MVLFGSLLDNMVLGLEVNIEGRPLCRWKSVLGRAKGDVGVLASFLRQVMEGMLWILNE